MTGPPLPGPIRVGSLWCWEPLKPAVRQLVEITEVTFDGVEWWITAQPVLGGRPGTNELDRFVEATVLVRSGDQTPGATA